MMNANAKLAPIVAHTFRTKGNLPATRPPTPAEIRAAREKAGLTQTEAAVKVCATLRGWQNWETEGDSAEHRRMHPGLFKLFLITTGQPVPEWLGR